MNDSDDDKNLWESIDNFRGSLTDKLKVSAGLLDILKEKHMLNDKNMKRISSAKNEKEKAERLLVILEAKENMGFCMLENAMEETGQSDVLADLRKEHTPVLQPAKHEGEINRLLSFNVAVSFVVGRLDS